MSYHGDYRAADVIDFKFSTVSTSAVPTTLSGAPAVSVYKSNSTTESTSGVTLTVDFDSRTGCNHVHITTNSDGTFYADGNDFDVVLTAGTVGGVSVVGIVVGSFSIANRSAVRPATAGRQLAVDSSGRVDLGEILGTAVATPATAGVLDVNVKNMNNVAATSITTVNANVGTTQPVNFTGTSSSALVKSDMVDIAGAAVSTSTAQIGVNTVNLGGTAQTGRDIGASVLLSSGTGTGQLDFTSGVVKSNLVQILGTALTETAGQIAAGFKQFFNISSPTSTMNVITTVTTTTTATNLTNAASNGDFTSTMKTSLNNSTPASITGAVGSVTARVTANTDQFAGQTVTAASGVTLPATVASTTNITAGTITTVTNLTNAPMNGDFTSAMKTSLNNATPSVTVSDKTGFSLSSAGIQAIWDALTSALTTVGSIGKLLVDNINATIASRLATSSYTTPPTTTQITDAVWDEPIASHLSAGSTGATLNAAGSAGDPWATLLPGSYTSGEAGFIVGTNLNATVASRSVPGDAMTLTSAYDAAKTAAAPGDAMTLTSGERSTLAGVIWANASRTLTSFGTLVADVAAAVWAAGTRTLTAFEFTVTTDVSATVTTNLDTTVSSRLATSIYTAPPSANDNADATLGRDWTAVSVVATNSLLNVLRGLGTRNKVIYNSGTGKFDVYAEDGSTVVYNITPTTDAAALPIISVTPS